MYDRAPNITSNKVSTSIVFIGLLTIGKSHPNFFQLLFSLKKGHISGGIYHKIQIELTYNSNHMEGSKLKHDQTRYIYETNTIGMAEQILKVDDIIETANHFGCIDMVIDEANYILTEKFVKELHMLLKSGTSDSRKDWFVVGDYKKLPDVSVKTVELVLGKMLKENKISKIGSFKDARYMRKNDK